MVDGLNEIPSVMAEIALRALESFAQHHSSGAVIVADRLTRRDIPSGRWGIAHIRVNREAVVRSLDQGGGDFSRIPSTPFFLNLLAPEGADAASTPAVFESFLDRHSGIAGEDLIRSAHAAFEAYVDGRYRMFSEDRFRATAGDRALGRLLESGLVV